VKKAGCLGVVGVRPTAKEQEIVLGVMEISILVVGRVTSAYTFLETLELCLTWVHFGM